MPPKEKYIGLAHGNGGRHMRTLIEEVFRAHLTNPALDTSADAVPLDLNGEIMVTTDGFTVQPLEFPGGNIGSLAVHGTVNDLAVAGAVPRYLTLNAFIEEGMEVARLDRLVAAMAAAAANCGVAVAAGDTKVVGRGECDGVYFATTGIGVRDPRARLGLPCVRPGDHLLVTGPVGAHGAAVLLAREEFGLTGDLHSDAASVLPAAQCLLAYPGLRFMRDPTRGGVATVLHEIARASGHGVELDEARVPMADPVTAVCELLGFDPLYLACEGRLLAVIDPGDSAQALAALRAGPAPEAALVGRIGRGDTMVELETVLGGRRVLDELAEDPLPRIC